MILREVTTGEVVDKGTCLLTGFHIIEKTGRFNIFFRHRPIVLRVIPLYLLGHKFGLLQLEVLSSLDVLRNPGSSSKFT